MYTYTTPLHGGSECQTQEQRRGSENSDIHRTDKTEKLDCARSPWKAHDTHTGSDLKKLVRKASAELYGQGGYSNVA